VNDDDNNDNNNNINNNLLGVLFFILSRGVSVRFDRSEPSSTVIPLRF